jgi:hypothetical protein
LTKRQKNLLIYFATEVGLYDARTLGRADAMSAVSLRNLGLMRSGYGKTARSNSGRVWWITEDGYQLGQDLNEQRLAAQRKG